MNPLLEAENDVHPPTHTHAHTQSCRCCSLQYSAGTPLGAICGRGDLHPEKPRAYGCIDTKVTNAMMAKSLEAEGGE